MARFDKIAVLNKIGSTGMVPVFYHKDAEVAKKVVKACYEAVFVRLNSLNRGDLSHEVFAEVVKYAAKECPEMAMGVGSVVDSATAALYLQLGANFVVGPLFNPEIARFATVVWWLILRDVEACLKWGLHKKQAATFANCSPVMYLVRSW